MGRASDRWGLLITFLVVIAVVVCAIQFVYALFFPTPYFGVPMVAAGIICMLIYGIIHSLLIKGWFHTLVFVVFSFIISFLTEWLGVNYGLWFGSYNYTNALGPMAYGVPFLIIVTWEGIIYPSHVLVDWLAGLDKKGYDFGPLGSVIVSFLAASATALFTTVWDLMTDPMAVHLRWWVWHGGGEYFKNLHGGVPLSNFFGWFSAVFVISFTYRAVFARKARYKQPIDNLSLFLVSFYTLWFFAVAGTLLSLGITLPIFIGAFTMGPIIVLAWVKYFAQRL